MKRSTPIVTLTGKAVDRAERDGVALVIGNDSPDAFCAGANLFALMVALGQNNLAAINAGWRPPPPRRIRVVGESGAATLRSALRSLAEAHRISEHDRKVSAHLARILGGGNVPAGTAVSEQHILDLEREAFLSLCGEEKTRERIQHMLATSKPLRN